MHQQQFNDKFARVQKCFFRRACSFHESLQPPPPHPPPALSLSLSAPGSIFLADFCNPMWTGRFLIGCKEYQYQVKITYPNSSFISFFDASNGTFRTRICELFCFVAVAVLRCDTLSVKNARRQFKRMEKLKL